MKPCVHAIMYIEYGARSISCYQMNWLADVMIIVSATLPLLTMFQDPFYEAGSSPCCHGNIAFHLEVIESRHYAIMFAKYKTAMYLCT